MEAIVELGVEKSSLLEKLYVRTFRREEKMQLIYTSYYNAPSLSKYLFKIKCTKIKFNLKIFHNLNHPIYFANHSVLSF